MCFCGCFCIRFPLLQKHPRLVLPVHSMVCLSAFGLALPVAISLFPQNSQVSTHTCLPPSARTLPLTFSPSPLFVCHEDGYGLKWCLLSCSSIWLLNCRHMCCQLLLFLSHPSPPPLLSLSRSLFTLFRGFQTNAPKKLHSCPPPPFHTPQDVCFRFCLTHSHTLCHLFLSKILQVLALVWIFTSARCFILAFYDGRSVSFDCEKCSRLERHGTLLILI